MLRCTKQSPNSSLGIALLAQKLLFYVCLQLYHLWHRYKTTDAFLWDTASNKVTKDKGRVELVHPLRELCFSNVWIIRWWGAWKNSSWQGQRLDWKWVRKKKCPKKNYCSRQMTRKCGCLKEDKRLSHSTVVLNQELWSTFTAAAHPRCLQLFTHVKQLSPNTSYKFIYRRP